MSYLVLARKYRPQDFSAVSGQEHVTRTLSNSIKRNKVAHALLLAGPRGVGKTSIARIISKCLNCEKGPTPEPCLKCTNCVEITQGTSLAVREIDGASHNSVDNVRELMDTFRSLPAPGSRYKVYIIDEVHMLSTAAFNALLKSLEEPPPHTVFILATTEVHKIPETVLSRCQRHDLRALSSDTIEEQLRKISQEEKLKIDPAALRLIARLADGSMRDAQSLLDRVQAFCEGTISLKDTSQLLGTVDKAVLFQISHSIFSRNTGKVLELVQEIFSTGIDATLFIREFVVHFRELLAARFGGEGALSRMGISDDDRVELLRQVESLSTHDVMDLASIARDGADLAMRSLYPRYSLEALMVRMAAREPVEEIGEIITRLKSGRSSSEVTPSREGSAPRTASVRVAGPASVQAARSVPEASPPPKGYRWADFVKFVSDGGGKVIAEHLKRLSVVKFDQGNLQARGPEFSVNSLKSKDSATKVLKALEEFSGVPNWRAELHTSERAGSAEPGSIIHEETTEKARTREQKETSISNHPQIQKLQKAFPGSKIEGIKIKDV